LPGDTGENHKSPQSGQSVSGQRFENGTSQIPLNRYVQVISFSGLNIFLVTLLWTLVIYSFLKARHRVSHPYNTADKALIVSPNNIFFSLFHHTSNTHGRAMV
jgi:hypothetical protein